MKKKSKPIDIFGNGGGEKLSQESDIPLFGTIPPDLELRQGGDNGVPLMVSVPDSTTGLMFQTIAQKISDQTKSFGSISGWQARVRSD